RAAHPDARHAPRRRRTQCVRLGLGHSRRSREPVDQAAPLLGGALGGHVCLSATLDLLARRHAATLARFAHTSLLIAFDYDGTLAPITATPTAARMRAATRQLLKQLARRYPCVVISGRALDDVAER